MRRFAPQPVIFWFWLSNEMVEQIVDEKIGCLKEQYHWWVLPLGGVTDLRLKRRFAVSGRLHEILGLS